MLKALKDHFLFLVCSFVFIPGLAFGSENVAAQLKTDLVSHWLVTVDGDTRTRTLKINDVAQKDGNTYLLAAEYGFSDENQGSVKAEIGIDGQERKLTLTTQANSLIVASQAPNGSFSGTFTASNGAPRGVRIAKISESELKSMLDAIQTARPKNAYVPTPCRAAGEQCLERPDFKVGDRWVFKTTNVYNNEELSKFEQKITEIGDDEIKIDQTTISSKNEANVGRVVKRKADRSTWTFPNSRIFDGKFVALAFPLEVGKTWTNEYKWKRSDSGTTYFDSPVKVEGWEEVQVPAGKFRALKVVHSGYYSSQTTSSSWKGRTAETMWYSPEIRKFVKYLFDDQGGDKVLYELIEYEVK